MKRRTYLALFLTSMLIGGIVVFSATIFSSSGAYATAPSFSSEQGLSFTVDSVVNISITGGTGLTISNLTPGSSSDSNIITVSTSSNTPNGYTLSSTVGSSTYASTYLKKNGTDNSNQFTNLSGNKGSLSSFSDNTWGYSYSTNNGSSWISGDITGTTASGYNGLPVYTGTPVKLINAANSGSNSIKFKIGAKASGAQLAGSYINVVNFIGVGKVITTTYNVSYNANAGSDTVTNMPSSQSGTTTTGAMQISTTEPTRENYMFKGWCTVATSDDTCSGDTVQPGGYLGLYPGTGSTSASVNKTLYAMWRDNSATPSVLAMQDVATWGSSLSVGDEIVAVDSRDGKEYYVAKLPDGNIWMTQNLDHDIVTTAGYYTSSNTDISSAWTPSTATYATSNTTWNGSYTSPESYDPGDLCWNGTIRSDYNGTLSNSTVSCSKPNHYHIGNYYNWTAAVAMNSSSSYTTNNADVNQSICPAGWRLPISGTSNTGSKSFYYLINGRYTSGTSGNIQSSPPYFVYGGYWYGESRGVGGYGDYWSSVVYDSSYAYGLFFAAGGYLGPQDYVGRNYGNSVRCVAR